MRLQHISADGSPTVLASTVETADSLVSQTRGLMFRRDLPEQYALIMEFSKAKFRGVHSFFVFEPIDVIWVVNDEVQKVKRFNPFTTVGFAKADRIIEVPAGKATNITPGDTITTSNA